MTDWRTLGLGSGGDFMVSEKIGAYRGLVGRLIKKRDLQGDLIRKKALRGLLVRKVIL